MLLVFLMRFLQSLIMSLSKKFEIVRAKLPDADAVKLCCDKAFEEYISVIGKCPAPMYYDYNEEIENHIVFIVLKDNETVGFSIIKDEDEEHYMWLDVLAVNPEYSGMGIGRELIAFSERYIFQCGKHECRLYTNTKFYRTVKIYLKYGFEIYNTVFENGYERFYMKKSLIFKR